MWCFRIFTFRVTCAPVSSDSERKLKSIVIKTAVIITTQRDGDRKLKSSRCHIRHFEVFVFKFKLDQNFPKSFSVFFFFLLSSLLLQSLFSTQLHFTDETARIHLSDCLRFHQLFFHFSRIPRMVLNSSIRLNRLLNLSFIHWILKNWFFNKNVRTRVRKFGLDFGELLTETDLTSLLVN